MWINGIIFKSAIVTIQKISDAVEKHLFNKQMIYIPTEVLLQVIDGYGVAGFYW